MKNNKQKSLFSLKGSIKMSNKNGKPTYKDYATKRAKKSNLLLDCLKAFIIGGFICCIGQGLFDLYKYFKISEENVKILVPVTLVFIAAVLTGLGIFDKIAKQAGAGTLVPITGFANAVVSPAIDNKAEGYVLGLGAKMFIVAGPVIVYGILASVVYGVIYYFVTM